MVENNKDKDHQIIEVKLVMPDKGDAEPKALSYYRETLSFLGKTSLPVAIFASLLLFKTEIANVIPSVDSFNFFGVSVNLIGKEKEIAKAVSRGDVDKAIELAEGMSSPVIQELVGIRGKSIERSKSAPESKEGMVADKTLFKPEQLQQPEELWENVLGISWVKPNDIFGFVYFLKIDDGIYLWPTDVDEQNDIATVLINTSDKGRKKGALLKTATLKSGDEVLFLTGGHEYSLKLVDIRNAGKIKTLAGYFSAKRRKL